MPSDLTINSMLPILSTNSTLAKSNDKTYVGIDFGTSTTVVSIAHFDMLTGSLKSEPIMIRQKLSDGAEMSSEKIPTVIAWDKKNILVGEGASSLKYTYRLGKNIWYSFKMKLGEDLGIGYPNSELKYITTAKDATKVFFSYLKKQIENYVQEKGLPCNIEYAVSIPASFEANQRGELVEALQFNKISVDKQALIDEPNAAFLSYVLSCDKAGEQIKIPDNSYPRILVFDYGAGTCDISILELSSDHNGVNSKNIAISKFEKCGGDDIDRFIAMHFLYPQLLEQNNVSDNQFISRERNVIVSHLLKAAELLKIEICSNVMLKMNDGVLPEISNCSESAMLNFALEVDSRIKKMTLRNPALKYSDFNKIMQTFLWQSAKLPLTYNGENKYVSIFEPIKSALSKAKLNKNDIDYVLLIGGSSKNPYVQFALKEFFSDSHILVPPDLQSHVSQGAAIHSLFYNCYGKNIVRPITSEQIFVITRGNENRTLIPAGSEVPSGDVIIDDLVTSKSAQKSIELPICVGNRDKMLFNLKIMAADKQRGFDKGTKVTVKVKITYDKLLYTSAVVNGMTIDVQPLNPFLNGELTSNQRAVMSAQRRVNMEAFNNGGKPTKASLLILAEAYHNAGDSLDEAETFEDINNYYPDSVSYNKIGVAYSNSGKEEKAIHFYREAFKESPNNSTILFNLANSIKASDPKEYKDLMSRSLEINPSDPVHLFDFGRWEVEHGNDVSGNEKIKKALELWEKKERENKLREFDYSWYSAAAEYVGDNELCEYIRHLQPQKINDLLYNAGNLLTIKNDNDKNLLKC